MMIESEFEQLRKANLARSVEWSGLMGLDNVSFLALELGGEVGELQNEIKKFVRFGNEWPGGKDNKQAKIDISSEIGDVMICLDRLVMAFDASVYHDYKSNLGSPDKLYGASEHDDKYVELLGVKIGCISGRLQDMSIECANYFQALDRVSNFDEFSALVNSENHWPEFKECVGKLAFYTSVVSEFFAIDLFGAAKDKFNQTSKKHGFKTVIA